MEYAARCTLRREGVNDCFTALGRHQMVEGREGDQRPLEEGLSKEREARRGGRAGMWPRRCTPQRVGRKMWRPYAPTGATGDDDENDLLVRWGGEEVIWSLLALTLLSHAVIVLLPSVCIVYLWMKTFKKYRMIILACPNSAGCIVRHENKLLLSEV